MKSFINLPQKVAPKTKQNIKRPSYTRLSYFSISFYNELRDAIAKLIKLNKTIEIDLASWDKYAFAEVYDFSALKIIELFDMQKK